MESERRSSWDVEGQRVRRARFRRRQNSVRGRGRPARWGSLRRLSGRPAVVDLWLGDAAPGRPWEEDTPAVIMSVTKGIAALAAHMCVDRGMLDLDAPVAKYWPEFGAAGKGGALVRHVLTHRRCHISPGIPGVFAPGRDGLGGRERDSAAHRGRIPALGSWNQGGVPRTHLRLDGGRDCPAGHGDAHPRLHPRRDREPARHRADPGSPRRGGTGCPPGSCHQPAPSHPRRSRRGMRSSRRSQRQTTHWVSP